MAFLEFKNVRIAGMSAGVPKRRVCNLDIPDISADWSAGWMKISPPPISV